MCTLPYFAEVSEASWHYRMYGSTVNLSNRIGLHSSSERYGSVADLAECMGHRSAFGNVLVADRTFQQARVIGRPFANVRVQMHESVNNLAECMGHRSIF